MEKQKRPSLSEIQLDKAEKQFESFTEEVKALDMPADPFNPNEKRETPAQTEITKTQFLKSDAPYLKPTRFISCSTNEKFNPAWQKMKDREQEYVKVIVENLEIIGEKVELWHKNWPRQHAEFWQIPVNVPVYIPRGIATQISRCKYHRMKTVDRPMDQVMAESSGSGFAISQGLVAKETQRRLDCRSAEGF